MSNYNCPQCGNIVIDSPGGPNEKHICTKYIPYSIRHNITDKDLAGLLDYLEREMGWSVEHDPICTMPRHFSIFDREQRLDIVRHGDAGIFFESRRPETKRYFSMNADLFFRTYKSILPVIRDLYSK